VLGINYFGDPHEYPYRIWPCYQPLADGRDAFGKGRLPRLVDELKPDAIVILNDPWNVGEYIRARDSCIPCRGTGKHFTDDLEWELCQRCRGFGMAKSQRSVPTIAWLAVDAENQQGEPLNALDHVVVWTDFARDVLADGGYTGPCSVVPLGCDLDVFYPRDRLESRNLVFPESTPRDAFVVGVVGRNQPRKRLDLTLEYFSQWIHDFDVPDAFLYLHVAPTGERACDIESLARFHDLHDRVLISVPDIGHGVATDVMPSIYSTFDVYLTTTQGEGWGLPALEAMACGVPCIVPDFAALGDGGWTGNAAVHVPCTTTALSAPLNTFPYTIGRVMDKEAGVKALEAMYDSVERRVEYRRRGIVRAEKFSWRSSGEKFRHVLERVVTEPKAREAVA
jgi:glycosyltransferase involved in cell wall biosynthesis